MHPRTRQQRRQTCQLGLSLVECISLYILEDRSQRLTRLLCQVSYRTTRLDPIKALNKVPSCSKGAIRLYPPRPFPLVVSNRHTRRKLLEAAGAPQTLLSSMGKASSLPIFESSEQAIRPTGEYWK
jgi:hypothetical protein